MKVKFFNRNLLNKFWIYVSILSTIFSIVLIFFEMPDEIKKIVGIIVLFLMVGLYLYLWKKANSLTKIELNINNSKVIVKVDDIFNQKENKVIAFNEYFDTIVDDSIISKKSLNGVFLTEILPTKSKTIDEFDNLIATDSFLDKSKLEINTTRERGKSQKYELGAIFKFDDYFFTSMTKFDKNNRAYINQREYIDFLLKFWDNVDILYNNNTVVIPVLGSGITRFKDNIGITDQELLNMLIWTFKLSRIKFTYPSEINIIVYKNKIDKINLFDLKNLEQI
ncbi:MAG: macro domain-containing protein [Fusobacteriaceae bacterium]